MAEDSTVESPSPEGGGEQSLEELRATLASKQEELAGLRAERERAAQEAAQRVQKAQLRAEIERVERAIAEEKSIVEVQNNLDAQRVGTGVPTEGVEPVPPLVDPNQLASEGGELKLETLEYGAVAEQTPPPAPEESVDEGDNEPSEGDEN